MQSFNEWMSFRQSNETEPVLGSYQFSGTFELDSMPNLVESSTPLDVEEAKKMIPSNFEAQFGGMEEFKAGQGLTEDNKEVLWICNSQGTVYLFEKN